MSAFIFLAAALVNRVLPKNKIYEHGKPSRAVRDGFVSQISQIVWQYKLAPETINLPARPNVPKIEIFSIELKTADISEDVLRCIDKAIPLPIFHILTFEDRIKTVAAYKRPNDADASRWVVDAYFESPWLPTHGRRALQPAPLPVALDMAGLYEQMLRRLMPHGARVGETLKDHVEWLTRLRSRQKAEYHRQVPRCEEERRNCRTSGGIKTHRRAGFDVDRQRLQ